MRKAAGGNRTAAPADRLQLFERRLVERHRPHPGSERAIEPEHEPLVEYRIDRPRRQRVQAPLVAGPPPPAPPPGPRGPRAPPFSCKLPPHASRSASVKP